MTLIKEWLLKTIAELEEERDAVPGAVNEDAAMALAAMKLALASLEAEAVCVIDQSNLDYLKSGSDADVWPASRTEMGDVLLYRAAPPAPVSLPDLTALDNLAGEMLNHAMNCERRVAVAYTHCAHRLAEEVRDLRSAMLQGAENAKSPTTMQTEPALDSSPKIAESTSGNSPVIPDCSCGTCRPVTFTDSRFVVCSECGNKRCPHANDHRNACTGSNEPGQKGSAYPAAPQQEVTQALAKGMERYGDAMQELAKKEVK